MNVRLSISIEVFPMIEILYLIILFSNIHFNYQVHLIVSAVWGHCEITMRYLAGLQPGPLSLINLSRLCIRQSVGKQGIEAGAIDDLMLPRSMKNYIIAYSNFYENEKILSTYMSIILESNILSNPILSVYEWKKNRSLKGSVHKIFS